MAPADQGYHLTARFGMAGGLWSSNHTGLDFAAPTGTPIFAVANGVITETGSAGAYGNRTIETLADGTEIWYCHQNSIGVQVGQAVIGGQQIGEVGSTGNTTGPHLHLEVRPGAGDPVDPDQALVFHGDHAVSLRIPGSHHVDSARKPSQPCRSRERPTAEDQPPNAPWVQPAGPSGRPVAEPLGRLRRCSAPRRPGPRPRPWRPPSVPR